MFCLNVKPLECTMLQNFRSKKQSAAGVWVPDEECPNCAICDSKFSLFNRRHHCRKCGAVVCGACSTNRLRLDISRSNQEKRICDKCAREHDQAALRRRQEEQTGETEDISIPASMFTEELRIPQEEAVSSINSLPLDGDWHLQLLFELVDIGSQRKDAVVSGLQVNSFRATPATAAGRGRGARRRSTVQTSTLREGSSMHVQMEWKKAGGGYFRGAVEDFGQFGRDGKITGSLQRSNGRVSMQIQVKKFEVTTSFNFVGAVNAKGHYLGTFSGCEISKSAGSVSGVFIAARELSEANLAQYIPRLARRASRHTEFDNDSASASPRSPAVGSRSTSGEVASPISPASADASAEVTEADAATRMEALHLSPSQTGEAQASEVSTSSFNS